MSDVKSIALSEPWRLGSGEPENAMDPTWDPERTARCDGQVKYETGSKWWVCEKCGRCGDHDFARAHRPIKDPVVFWAESMKAYIEAREKEGVSRELATYQLFHIAGVAIKYASTIPSDEIGNYVDQLVVR